VRGKDAELHCFWKSMLPYFATINEEDLKLLMPLVRHLSALSSSVCLAHSFPCVFGLLAFKKAGRGSRRLLLADPTAGPQLS